VIVNYRRYLKRRNYSSHTVKNYLNTLRHYVLWLDVPIEQVTARKINAYIDHLLSKRREPKTINCHLGSIRRFYDYLRLEEELPIDNPVKRGVLLRLAKPLPKHLRDAEVSRFLQVLKGRRDRAMFMLMLRCGLRVEEVANLTLDAIDWRRLRLYVVHGKGAKDRVVYISPDTREALLAYVKQRLASHVKKIFLVEKGAHKGSPISVRGIEAHGVLRAEERPGGVLPPPAAYHGHPDVERRCRPGEHPGSLGPQPDQDHSALLQHIQS